MSERELIKALQELIAKHAPPTSRAGQMAQEISRQEEIRVRFWAAITLLLFAVGAPGLILFFIGMYQFTWHVRLGGSFGDTWLITHLMWVFGASAVALLAACVSTVFLVFSSRRATLRQINVSLAEISHQLKQLRQAGQPVEKEQNGSG
ncbi:MAG TPA: hypothetical protein VK395_18050 [Gemmataceae bacterium]|nr:hypothetical protein [Gemmataceae bacterium]